MNARRWMALTLGGTMAASVQAQQPSAAGVSLDQIFLTHDLVCFGQSSAGRLLCELRPKTADGLPSAAAGAVGSPLPPTAVAPTPALSFAADPPSGNTSSKKALAGATNTPQKKASFAEALQATQEVDLTVPSSPAFAVLGLSPEKVQRPGTVRELASSVVRGFDDNGKPKTGLALDFAPLPLFYPQAIRGGKDYASRWGVQALTRTTFSVATAKAAEGTGSQLAWGVRMGVFDLGDPGLQYEAVMSCIENADLRIDVPGSKKLDTPETSQEAALRQATADCVETKGQRGLWAKPALYVGFGQSRYSASGRLGGTTPAVRSLWATYSHGLYRDDPKSLRVLFQLHVQRRTDDRAADPADASRVVRQDTSTYIGRLRAGREDWHFFGDGGVRRVVLDSVGTERLRHFGLGAEFKLKPLGEDLWLQLGMVRESGFRDGSSVNTATAGLRFGSKPLFATP